MNQTTNPSDEHNLPDPEAPEGYSPVIDKSKPLPAGVLVWVPTKCIWAYSPWAGKVTPHPESHYAAPTSVPAPGGEKPLEHLTGRTETPASGEQGSQPSELASLRQRLEVVEKDRDHWKANAKNQAEIRRVTLTRPDLKERSEYVQEIIAARDAAETALAEALRREEGFRKALGLCETAIQSLSVTLANTTLRESEEKRQRSYAKASAATDAISAAIATQPTNKPTTTQP